MLFDFPDNILPKDGAVFYYPQLLGLQAANDFYEALLSNIQWLNDEAIVFGKHIVTKRKYALHADKPYHYHYSNIQRTALPWIDELLKLKAIVEMQCNERFNTCLLNLYHDGSEGMSWHSDAEKELKKNGVIASVSLGAQRKFSFKHKATKKTISIELEHGSLLIMKDETQTHWLHQLPTTKMVQTPRINLTFRQMNE